MANEKPNRGKSKGKPKTQNEIISRRLATGLIAAAATAPFLKKFFPNAEKFDGIPIPKPVRNDVVRSFSVLKASNVS